MTITNADCCPDRGMVRMLQSMRDSVVGLLSVCIPLGRCPVVQCDRELVEGCAQINEPVVGVGTVQPALARTLTAVAYRYQLAGPKVVAALAVAASVAASVGAQAAASRSAGAEAPSADIVEVDPTLSRLTAGAGKKMYRFQLVHGLCRKVQRPQQQ